MDTPMSGQGRVPRPDRPTHPEVTKGVLGNTDNVFFAAVEMTRMPMTVTDPNLPDNPIVFANEAFIQMTGYAPEEIIGRNCRFLQGRDTSREAVADVKSAIEQRTQVAVEMLNYRKDGSAFWNALYISPVFDHDGRLIYYFGSQLDVSRRRDAESALHQAQKMEAVGQLTGGIAHDFNNLLTVIVGSLEGLLEEERDPRRRRLLDRITLAANKGAILTQQLLAFARKQRLDERPTNLNLLVGSLTEMVQRTLGADVEIATRVAPDLWTARVDAVQAELALLNILINARDAIQARRPEEGGRVLLRTTNQTIGPDDPLTRADVRPGDYAVLSVTDNGGGISQDILPRVTEPFFTTKDVGKGSGMGLAMVYGFMRQSRGHVRITSEPGRGTTVSLYFPALDAAEKAESPGLEATPLVRGARDGEAVLVVEDNADVLDLAVGILGDFGYTAYAAASVGEALRVLESQARVDLMFSDIVMPGGMNGVSLARMALSLRPRLRVLLTTGFADRMGEAAAEQGEFGVLSKPYRRAELATRVRRILDGPTGV